MDREQTAIEKMILSGEIKAMSVRLDPKLHDNFSNYEILDTVGCMGSKILTASCGYFDYADPQPESICIEDISRALGNLCRFTGHCRYYSVAEHSIHCLRLAQRLYPGNEELQFAALMHDAVEAFVTDLPKPLKNMCPSYREIEARVEAVIAEKYQISSEWHKQVKEIDLMMLKTEKGQLFPGSEEWAGLEDIPDTIEPLYNDIPEEACGEFLYEAQLHLDRKGIK